MQDDTHWRKLADEMFDGVYVLDTERRIVYWNPAAEAITGFPAQDVVGTACRHNILMHVDEQGNELCHGGRCPAGCSILDGGRREDRVFLRHRDGHRVPVMTRIIPFGGGAGGAAGVMEIFRPDAPSPDATRLRQLKDLAMRDPLTGIGNRRYGEARLSACLSDYSRYGWPFGVLFVDVDHFKRVNDAHGHAVGDAVLRMVGQTLLGAVRASDSVARWGGEEFIVFPRHIDDWQLERLGEKIRRLVASAGYNHHGATIQVTVSVGCALIGDRDDGSHIVDRADRAMYACKQRGRNKVVFLAGSGPEGPHHAGLT